MVIKIIKMCFLYFKAFIKFIFSRETLSNAIFAIQIAQSIYTNKKCPNLRKNKAVIRKLEIAQSQLDNIQKLISNRDTRAYVNGINNCDKDWKGFSATIVKDKHGEGNNGINLGYKTNVAGQNVGVGYDPSTGKAKINVGPFSFGVGK